MIKEKDTKSHSKTRKKIDRQATVICSSPKHSTALTWGIRIVVSELSVALL